MFSKLFDSISYPLLGFVFFIYVTIMYFSNKRYNSYANKTYKYLLLFTFLTAVTFFLDCLATDGVGPLEGHQNIFARLYILSTMLWASTYSYYLIINFMTPNADIKKLRILKIIVYSFNIILFIVSCFLELEYHHRSIYAIGGKALIPLYVEFAATGLIYIICMIFYNKVMNKTQLIMHSTILFILVTMTLFRFFTTWDVNYFTYIMCLIPIALYFSSESSAYLLSKELETSKDKYKKIIDEDNKKIQKLSSDLNEHLSTILYHQNILNNSELTESDFKNEKIYIYNETKYIYDLLKSSNENQVYDSEVRK